MSNIETEGDETVILFRPTGPDELALIEKSGYSAFPPRLFWQPIFYPVLGEAYATQIARDWNAREASQAMLSFFGFAATFCVGTRSIRWEVLSTRNIGSRQKTWRSSIIRLLARLRWWPNSTRDLARLFTPNDQFCVPSQGAGQYPAFQRRQHNDFIPEKK
jgi:hypothetical protein